MTISQAANDNEILTLKSSDVGHGAYGIGGSEEDEPDKSYTFGAFLKSEADSGGLNIRGYKDNHGVGGNALFLQGVLDESADTTKNVAAVGVVTIRGYSVNASGNIDTLDTNENILVLGSGGNAQFIFDADGDSHQNVGTAWTNFDDEDDAMICRSVGIVMDQGSIIKSQFDDWTRDHEADLVRTGLLPKPTADGEKRLMNTTQLARLHNGAIWQLHEKMETLQLQLNEANDKLARLETN